MADLTLQQFGDLFHTFGHSVFRLEPRESYAGVSYEREPFERWLAGEPVEFTEGDEKPWFDNVRACRAEGKRFERVRVVSVPHSDYTRFALTECTVNIEAGEDIRYLPRHQAPELPVLDYWLFDSHRMVVLHYDEHDDLTRIEQVTEPEMIVQANYWRDAAWHRAVPWRTYVGSDERAPGASSP